MRKINLTSTGNFSFNKNTLLRIFNALNQAQIQLNKNSAIEYIQKEMALINIISSRKFCSRTEEFNLTRDEK
jgi:hypothetical protein